jgi:hypothetical protein
MTADSVPNSECRGSVNVGEEGEERSEDTGDEMLEEDQSTKEENLALRRKMKPMRTKSLQELDMY